MDYLVFGLIRQYKRVPHIVRVFRRHAREHDRLVIAGKPWTTTLQEAVERAAGGDPRITIRWGFVADEDVPGLFREADAVVVAHDGLTSGVAVQAAAYVKPVVDGDLRPIATTPLLPWQEVARLTKERAYAA